ncbi:hypothetical protein F5Y06DRAFT_257423 [Hypoxylon sp. FL0890]|nr:hypothetical protein F5Y06DRAFT_257423 [Hypoxylon sp. FL0890]
MIASNLKAQSVLLAALLSGQAVARTDLSGCVSSATVKYGGASLIWYVPGTGEICEFLDCGGGRAPPKTTVPGCAAYSGTATYSPSYLPGFGVAATPSSTGNSAQASVTGETSVEITLSGSASEYSITTPPTTTTLVTSATGTADSSADSSVSSNASASTGSSSSSGSSSGSGSNAESSSPASSTSSGSSQGAQSSSVSQGGAAMPTAVAKGAMGVVAGLVAGVAML